MKNEINNGGSTNYYDLPLPTKKDILELMDTFIVSADPTINEHTMFVDALLAILPQTLNDLIEYKNMKPWQHEVMKAVYAIRERAEKNGGSELREVNKIIYYAERRKKQLLEGSEGSEVKAKPKPEPIPYVPQPAPSLTDALTKSYKVHINDQVMYLHREYIEYMDICNIVGIFPNYINYSSSTRAGTMGKHDYILWEPDLAFDVDKD